MTVADEIKKALSSALQSVGISVVSKDVPLEHPGELSHGDYATGIALAKSKEAGVNPRKLAESLVALIGNISGVESIKIAGPGFINFTLTPASIGKSLDEARETDMWGSGDTHVGKKVMVEYTDPNPFKEFHIGHLMSNAIGESISRLLQFSGAEVRRACYQGDVGPHVAKAIWGKIKTPESTWGTAYTVGATEYEEHKQEIDMINQKVYDKSDSEINKLYDEGREDSLKSFDELYSILGTKFDYFFFESITAPRGMKIVQAHTEIFESSDGAIVYKGESDGLHTRVFVTSKGLPTYETKELGLAELKSETWSHDISITVTAHEQADYFKVVLAAMKKTMPDFAAKIRHISHGMMRFAEGKMSSRTGNVVTGRDLLFGLKDVAKIRAEDSRADDKEQLAEQVAMAGIKYQILKQGSGKDIIFDREKALSLEGDSGPYLQYAYARTNAILAKAKESGVDAKIDESFTPNDVARLIPRFPEIVARAADLYEPHLVTTYLIELAAAFNSWYAQEQVLDGTLRAAHKVALVEAVGKTLKNGLWILGIPAPAKM